MSGFWKLTCTAVLGLALTAGPAAAQHRPHPAGGHHAGGAHPAAVHHGGYYGGHGGYYGGHGGYYGGHPYYGGHHHNSGWAIGIGLGLGFGSPLYGGYGYGYPYYGGYYGGLGYPYAYPAYGIGSVTYAVPSYEVVPVIPPAVSTYVEPAAPAPAPAPQPATAGQAAPATVSVVVPAGAEVWFNGKKPADGSGPFVSDPIPPGQTVTLEVRARWDGSDRSMRIPLRAGDKMSVDLTRQ